MQSHWVFCLSVCFDAVFFNLQPYGPNCLCCVHRTHCLKASKLREGPENSLRIYVANTHVIQNKMYKVHVCKHGSLQLNLCIEDFPSLGPYFSPIFKTHKILCDQDCTDTYTHIFVTVDF